MRASNNTTPSCIRCQISHFIFFYQQRNKIFSICHPYNIRKLFLKCILLIEILTKKVCVPLIFYNISLIYKFWINFKFCINKHILNSIFTLLANQRLSSSNCIIIEANNIAILFLIQNGVIIYDFLRKRWAWGSFRFKTIIVTYDIWLKINILKFILILFTLFTQGVFKNLQL